MLLQRETATTSAAPQGTTTVPAEFTSEEIAQAITKLEAERHTARSEADETAQLSTVLEQLQLDLPAAQVAEQIQKARLARQQQKQTRRRRSVLAGVGTAGACLIAAGFMWLQSRHIGTTVAAAAVPVVATNAIPAQSITPEKLVVVDRTSGEAVSKTLAEVPEGTRVTIGGDELLNLLGVSKEYYGGITRPDARDWTVFRKDGICYLHAYTTLRQTHAALLATPEIRLYNKNDAQIAKEEPAARVPVNLPINAIDQYTINSQDAMSDYQILDLHLGNVDRVSFGK